MSDNWFKTDKWLKRGKDRQLVKKLKDYSYHAAICLARNYYNVYCDLYENGRIIFTNRFACNKLSHAKEMEHSIRISLLKIFKRK
jgi:hypothetical protein